MIKLGSGFIYIWRFKLFVCYRCEIDKFKEEYSSGLVCFSKVFNSVYCRIMKGVFFRIM